MSDQDLRTEDWLRAFREELLRTSGPSLIGTLVVALGWALLGVLLVTPERLAAVDPGYLMRSERDDFAYVTHRTFEVQHGEKERSVAFIGDSALKYALPDEKTTSEFLREALGKPTRAIQLCGAGLLPWELSQLVDAVGVQATEAVVVSVSPRMMGRSSSELAAINARPRLGLPRSELFDEEVRLAGLSVPPRTGRLLVDQFRFYSLRAMRSLESLVTGPTKEWAPYRARMATPFTGKAVWNKNKHAGYEDNHLANIAVFGRVIDRRMREGPVEIVLLESPWCPAFRAQVDPDLLRDYRALMAEFSALHGVHYRDLNEKAGLESGDFHDWCHICSEEPRLRFARALAEELSVILGASRDGEDR